MEGAYVFLVSFIGKVNSVEDILSNPSGQSFMIPIKIIIIIIGYFKWQDLYNIQ